MNIYNNPLCLARFAELAKLRKAELVRRARNPVPHVETYGELEKWTKDELIWSIVRAEFELDDGSKEQ